MSTVREVTYDLLRSFGMTTIFGNPGSTELPFLKDYPDDFSYVLGLQEAAAVGIADGYAQGTGRAAFVNLHTAPGLGNAMGAVITAYHNRTPLIITAGQQDRRHLAPEPFLSGRLVELAQPYVKWSHEPTRAEDVPYTIERAYHAAMQAPQGPVFLSIPMDDWGAPAPSHTRHEVSQQAAPDPASLDRAVRILQSSRRPTIVAGSGVGRSGALNSMIALAEKLRAAVWADPVGSRLSFPQDHALFQGRLAPAQARLAEQLSEYDVVLVVGAPVFLYYPYVPGPTIKEGTQVIQLTDDPDEAHRAMVGMSIVGDLEMATMYLNERLPEANLPAPPPPPQPQPPTPETPMPVGYVLHTLTRTLPDDTILVEEAPSYRPHFYKYVRIKRVGSYHSTASGGLGFAMPAAVGLKLALPDRPVVCVIGEGSAMYSNQALWTAARYGVAAVFVVINNGQYAILKSYGKLIDVGARVPGLDIPGLEIVQMARSFGCEGETVENPDELSDAFDRALNAQRPYVVNVPVDPTVPGFFG